MVFRRVAVDDAEIAKRVAAWPEIALEELWRARPEADGGVAVREGGRVDAGVDEDEAAFVVAVD